MKARTNVLGLTFSYCLALVGVGLSASAALGQAGALIEAEPAAAISDESSRSGVAVSLLPPELLDAIDELVDPVEGDAPDVFAIEASVSGGIQVAFLPEELLEGFDWGSFLEDAELLAGRLEEFRIAICHGLGPEMLDGQWHEIPGGQVRLLDPSLADALVAALGPDYELPLLDGALVVYAARECDPSAEMPDLFDGAGDNQAFHGEETPEEPFAKTELVPEDAGIAPEDEVAMAAEQVAAINNALSNLSAVDTVLLPPFDIEAARQEDAVRRAENLPPRFALPYPVSISPFTGGTWEMLDDETAVWRLRIVSPGALSLNLGFGAYRMPAGGRMYIHATDQSYVLRAFSDADNQDHGQLWTPVILSDDIVLMAVVPVDALDKVQLELITINHGYRFFGEDSGGRAGSCHVDVVCDEGNRWRSEIPAVGVYTVGGVWRCTGCMVDNTSHDQTPYFLTARHCGVTAENAGTVVVYWNFESPTCGQHGGGSLSQFTSGSTFRASNAASDFTLLQLNARPNAAWGVTYAGWDRGTGNPSSAVCIHHPDCDEKSISIENDPLTTTSYRGTTSPGDGNYLRVADWDIGSTEGGSSGAPLFNSARRIVGQLRGGDAACGNDLSDWFGRFSRSWTGGGTNATRLSNWLDPGNTGATTCGPPPVPPTGVSASDGTYCNYVRVSWNSVTGATGYSVWRSRSWNGTYTMIGAVYSTTYDDLEATPGAVYWYKVRAHHQSFSMPSGFSNIDSGYRPARPATPTGVSASDGTYCGYVRIAWNHASGATRYKIFRSTSAHGTYALIATDNASPYDDTTASAGMTYYYMVQADALCPSDFSSYDSGYRPSGVPAAPTGVTASDGTYCSYVRVSWNSASGATAYEIWRSTSPDGVYLQIGTDTASPYDDTTAVANRYYYYRVTATNACGRSSFSSYDRGHRPDLPAAPTGVSASDSSYCGYVRITWNAVSGATSYKIYRSTSATGTYTQIGTDMASPYDDTTAVPGTQYYYKLKATNACGDSAFSNYDAGRRRVCD